MNIKVLMRRPVLAKVALVTVAAEWFASQLLNPFQVELMREVRIDLRRRRNIPGRGEGSCRSIWRLERPRDFTIVLNRDLDAYWLVRVLAHEFVHVKQRFLGQLTYTWNPDEKLRSYWNGEDHSATPYEQLPWEVEANALEVELADRFMTA